MPEDIQKHNWQISDRPARLWVPDDHGYVVCHLSPRNCRIREGGLGYCRVRANRGGELKTLNYGKSVAMTEENIETEAVNNFAPGARILSMGNIGCMMNCDYCHNWQTSQARFVGDDIVHTYTPEQVVEECITRNIRVMSWTYNDPVVWHEFVMDTAALGREHGIISLYKSAFYISETAISELTDVIDIFSLSLKSMDPQFYKRVTKGRLEPVLAGIEQVYRAGKHLELSMLLVTDSNDAPGEPEKVARWMLDRLDPDVPLHYVRFHPDYKYTHVERTPVDRLVRARQVALEMGLRYVYLGNLFGHEGAHTSCPGCGTLLITRHGLRATVIGLDAYSCCLSCGYQTAVHQPFLADEGRLPDIDVSGMLRAPFDWRGNINAVHVEVRNRTGEPQAVVALSEGGVTSGEVLRTIPLAGNGEFRFMLSRIADDQKGTAVCHEPAVEVSFFEVFDRAHFPPQSTVQITHSNDSVPEPALLGIPTVRSSGKPLNTRSAPE